MRTKDIVPQPAPVSSLTPLEIHDFQCPACNAPTDIGWYHIGGMGKQPHIICKAEGCTVSIIQRISDAEFMGYINWLGDLDRANTNYVTRLEAELPPAAPSEEQKLRWRVQDLEGVCLNTAGELRLLAGRRDLREIEAWRLLVDAAERLEKALDQQARVNDDTDR